MEKKQVERQTKGRQGMLDKTKGKQHGRSRMDQNSEEHNIQESRKGIQPNSYLRLLLARNGRSEWHQNWRCDLRVQSNAVEKEEQRKAREIKRKESENNHEHKQDNNLVAPHKLLPAAPAGMESYEWHPIWRCDGGVK